CCHYRYGVIAHRLRAAHRDVRMMVRERRRSDADALLESLGAEISAPRPCADGDAHVIRARSDAHRMRSIEDQRAQIAGIELVLPHAILLGFVELVLAVRNLHREDLCRTEQTVGVIAQAEDRGTVDGLVAAYAF